MGVVLKFPERAIGTEPAMADQAGRPMQLYTLSYVLDDRTWAVEVWAYSFDDADARVEAIRKCLKLDGMIVATVPGGLK